MYNIFYIYNTILFTEPHTTILGNKELYIEAGSTINLTCIIQAGAMRDTHIFWNYDGKVRENALFQTANPKKIRILNSGELHKSFI